MGAFFTAVLAKFVSFAAWIAVLVTACFAAAWLLGTDLGCWVFEQLMTLVITVLNGFNIDFGVFDPSQYLAFLSPEMVNIMGLLHVGTCFQIILGAILIKVTLQVIPFTRLGS